MSSPEPYDRRDDPGARPQRPDNGPVSRADWVGQGGAIEQSRAAMEVVMSLQRADTHPRSERNAAKRMQDACGRMRLAEKAQFRLPRAGSTVSGPSIHLARELARCWGNLHYGITELRRDDVAHQSEMMAWAWDLESNTREAILFINPHKRDKREGGPQLLTSMSDVYESNANVGARRVREAIFAVLPGWYVDDAKDLCQATVQRGNGEALPTRIRKAIDHFANAWRVGEDRLVAKVGKPTDQWTAMDLAPLLVIAQSLKADEVTVEDEFPEETRKTIAPGDVVGSRPTNAAPRERGPEQAGPPPAAPADPPPGDTPAREGDDPADAVAPAGPPAAPPAAEKPAARGRRRQAAPQEEQPLPPEPPEDDSASDGPRTDRAGYSSASDVDPSRDPWGANGGQGTLGDGPGQ